MEPTALSSVMGTRTYRYGKIEKECQEVCAMPDSEEPTKKLKTETGRGGFDGQQRLSVNA